MSVLDPVELTLSQIDLKNKILLEMSHGAGITEENAESSEPPPNITLTGFFDKTRKLIDSTQGNADQKILVVETMPEENTFQDPQNPYKDLSGLILTTVLRREPGTLAGGNQPFSGKRTDVRPRLIRKTIKTDPSKPGETTYIMSKSFDNLVGFNICARTNKRADELCEWFEDLMEKNRWYFEFNGFSRVLYKGRMADLRRDDALMKVSFRPMKYYVRTETYYTVTEHQLNRLIVQLTTDEY